MKAAVLLVVVACSGKHTDAPVAPTLVVLDAGAEPRQVLRLDLAPRSERSEMTIKARQATRFVNTVFEEGSRSVDVPSIKVRARTESLGDGRMTWAVEDVSAMDDVVDPGARTAAEQEIARLRQARGSWRVSPTGELADIQFEEARFADRLASVALRFPDVAVGVGASWRETTRTKTGAITWDIRRTYRVRALTDAAVTIESTSEMRAGEQALSVEPRRTVTVTSANGTGTSETVVPLHGVVSTGSSRTVVEQNLRIVSGAKRLTATVRTETELSVQRIE